MWHKFNADFVILSTTYDTWETEHNLKSEILQAANIEEYRILTVPRVTSTYDEAMKADELIRDFHIKNLIVVCEEWHAPRAWNALSERFPEIGIVMAPFKSPSFEATLEPSGLKSWRTKYNLTWMAWNILFWVFPPKR